MATQPGSFITPEQYLEIERAAPTKSEYYRGEMFAMAGASMAHVRITTNLVVALGGKLRGGSCEVFSSDLRLLIKETGLYTYPDIIVVCGEPVLTDKHFDTLTNPSLIIEVLSKSTKDYDLGGKFHQYMHIPSLREYLTVSQTEMLVGQSIRQADGAWLVKEIGENVGRASLSSMDIELNFSEIYERVQFKAA